MVTEERRQLIEKIKRYNELIRAYVNFGAGMSVEEHAELNHLEAELMGVDRLASLLEEIEYLNAVGPDPKRKTAKWI